MMAKVAQIASDYINSSCLCIWDEGYRHFCFLKAVFFRDFHAVQTRLTHAWPSRKVSPLARYPVNGTIQVVRHQHRSVAQHQHIHRPSPITAALQEAGQEGLHARRLTTGKGHGHAPVPAPAQPTHARQATQKPISIQTKTRFPPRPRCPRPSSRPSIRRGAGSLPSRFPSLAPDRPACQAG